MSTPSTRRCSLPSQRNTAESAHLESDGSRPQLPGKEISPISAITYRLVCVRLSRIIENCRTEAAGEFFSWGGESAISTIRIGWTPLRLEAVHLTGDTCPASPLLSRWVSQTQWAPRLIQPSFNMFRESILLVTVRIRGVSGSSKLGWVRGRPHTGSELNRRRIPVLDVLGDLLES